MRQFWNLMQLCFSALGGWIGYFLGGNDKLIVALLLFVLTDFVTGIMRSIADKTLSSEIGFKGVCRKILIFMLVGMANVLDEHLGQGAVLRTATIFFFASNEGLSLIENASYLGLPIPKSLRDVLVQLHDKSENNKADEKD